MGKRGPKPQPAEIKRRRGNPGKRALGKDALRPGPAIPAMPADLKGEAAKEWKRITALLHKLNLISHCDRAVLAIYCQAWGRWREAEAELAKTSPVVMTPNGCPITNPYLTVANRAMAELRRAIAELGLSPSARAGVTPAGGGTNPDDEFFAKEK